jgi:hypothetical protein
MQLKDLLKSEGFMTVALASEDIEAQQILIKDGTGALKRLPDKVAKLFKQGAEAALPLTKKNIIVSGITGSVVTHSAFDVSMGFLDELVKKIGVDLSLTFKKSADDELVFMFESPVKDEISSFIDMDNYLNDATLNEGTYGEMLKHNDIFIITAVLKSKNFVIGLVDKSKLSGALTLPSIKDFVDSKISASKDTDINRVHEYKGDTPLVFGIQAVQVLYEQKFWERWEGKKGRFRLINVKDGVIVRDESKVRLNFLMVDNVQL